MPIFQQLVNFDETFYTLPDTPIIINDISVESEEERKELDNLITTSYSDDLVSLIPKCECGELKGESSKLEFCTNCNTHVKSSIEDDITSLLWFRKPEGVHKLISPIALIMLKNRFRKSGFDTIRYFMDTSYRSTAKNRTTQNLVESLNIPRGYNHFIENFTFIIESLLTLKPFKLRGYEVDFLKDLMTGSESIIFSDYIPLPNRALIIIEKRSTGVYVDPIVIDAKDVIENLASIDSDVYNSTLRAKENKTVRSLLKLCAYYEKYFSTKLAPKTGQIRKHVFGTRTNHSCRGVITSITVPHHPKDLHMPWGVGLSVFSFHLVNKLTKLGMSVNSAKGIILGHMELYNPLLAGLLDELILESNGGISCLLGRNPSLLAGSLQKLRITKFKKDVTDRSISLSLLICVALNADFDGDECPVTMALDDKMADLWTPFESKYDVLLPNIPNKTSRNISLSKPLTATTSQWLNAILIPQ